MIQDREQKKAALRYAVAKRWFPQLELEVSTYITLSRTPTNITDIDVFAAVPDEFVGFRSIVIDCKTRKGESPINRAMWQKGLIARLGADGGICVLRVPKIVADHRYTAAQFGVALVTESEFEAFASATAPLYKLPIGAIANLDLWEKYFAIAKQFPALAQAIQFSRSSYWMSDGPAEACIRTIFLLTALRPELDPDRPEHLTVVADIAALFLHSLARIVVKIFAAYLQPGSREELSTALLLFLYGGRNSYDHLNRIRRMLAQPKARSADREASTGELFAPDESQETPRDAKPANDQPVPFGQRDLSLPEWSRFVELVRQMLDAPIEVNRSPLLMREIGWSALGGVREIADGVSSFSRDLALASPQGARFAVLGLTYLCRAAALPREFIDTLGGRLLAAQVKPPRS